MKTKPRLGFSITKLPDYPITNLFNFLVRRMLATTAAELLQFQPVWGRLPVLGLRIIPFLALTALQRNDLSGHENSS